MRKILLIVKIIILVPIRLFTKISPLALIRNSSVSKKSAVLTGTRLYGSTVDDYSIVARRCFIQNTKIGKFCSISENCIIGTHSHPISWVSTSPVFHKGKNTLRENFQSYVYDTIKTTVIENDVWIGVNACIVGGVRISTGAIIGAGAIVTKDVGNYEIWGGNPARLIRKRFDDDTIKSLLESKWWDLSKDELKKQSADFDKPSEFLGRYGKR